MTPKQYDGSSPIQQYVDVSHEIAKDKGFWDTNHSIGESLMLIVTELAEAMEEYRTADLSDRNWETDVQYEGESRKPVGFAIEIADALIRIFDLCGRLEIPIDDVLWKKIYYNLNRPHKHGKNG